MGLHCHFFHIFSSALFKALQATVIWCRIPLPKATRAFIFPLLLVGSCWTNSRWEVIWDIMTPIWRHSNDIPVQGMESCPDEGGLSIAKNTYGNHHKGLYAIVLPYLISTESMPALTVNTWPDTIAYKSFYDKEHRTQTMYQYFWVSDPCNREYQRATGKTAPHDSYTPFWHKGSERCQIIEINLR